MKQKLAIFVLFSILLVTFTLYGCSPAPVDAETDLQIREYFASIFPVDSPDDISYMNLGTYRGNVAFYMPGLGLAQVITEVEVAGVRFSYPNSNQIHIWSEGDYYTMPEAYEKGLIGYFDLHMIRHIYEKEQKKEREAYNEEYLKWLEEQNNQQ